MYLGYLYVPVSELMITILAISLRSNKGIMPAFPHWQVSFHTVASNGSLHRDQFGNTPSLWWMDMNIDMQLTCEEALGMSRDVIQLELKGAAYLISFSNMTQLNLKTGSLRRIRRRLLLHLM